MRLLSRRKARLRVYDLLDCEDFQPLFNSGLRQVKIIYESRGESEPFLILFAQFLDNLRSLVVCSVDDASELPKNVLLSRVLEPNLF